MIARIATARTRVATVPATGRPVFGDPQPGDLTTARKTFSVAVR